MWHSSKWLLGCQGSSWAAIRRWCEELCRTQGLGEESTSKSSPCVKTSVSDTAVVWDLGRFLSGQELELETQIILYISFQHITLGLYTQTS